VTSRSPAALASTVVLAGVLLAAAVQLQAARERTYPPAEPTADTLYVRSGTALRRLTGAYNALFADVYWIRAVQYYGGTKLQLDAKGVQPGTLESKPAIATEAYPALYPLLDITTTLDPRFNIAYRFGSVFLAEAYPRGADRPDLAIALLEKGLRERPDKWQYLQDIGFVYYWFRHDYLSASRWFQKAAEVPGAPWFLRSLAATTLEQGGDRQSSRAMWTMILQTAEVDWVRKDAQRRLLQLQALDVIDALQRVVNEYSQRTGGRADWPALVAARVLRGVPLDPTGVPYVLSENRVQLSRSSTLWPPPEEPSATGSTTP
jgi:tetratricopeptide (TPR) repeat protein